MNGRINRVSRVGRVARAGGGVQAPFNPDSVTGLDHDWFAGDLATVFSDAGTTPAVQNDTLQQWNDRKGTGHFKQSTANNRPQLILSGGRYYVDCATLAANERFMATDAFTAVGTRTLFISFVAADQTSANLTDGIVGTNRTVAGWQTDATWQGFAGSTIFGGTRTAAAHVMCVVFNGASSAVYVNGGTAVATGNTGSQTMTGLTLGARYSLDQGYSRSRYRRLLTYTGALSAANINIIGTGLAADLGTAWGTVP